MAISCIYALHIYARRCIYADMAKTCIRCGVEIIGFEARCLPCRRAVASGVDEPRLPLEASSAGNSVGRSRGGSRAGKSGGRKSRAKGASPRTEKADAPSRESPRPPALAPEARRALVDAALAAKARAKERVQKWRALNRDRYNTYMRDLRRRTREGKDDVS